MTTLAFCSWLSPNPTASWSRGGEERVMMPPLRGEGGGDMVRLGEVGSVLTMNMGVTKWQMVG